MLFLTTESTVGLQTCGSLAYDWSNKNQYSKLSELDDELWQTLLTSGNIKSGFKSTEYIHWIEQSIQRKCLVPKY